MRPAMPTEAVRVLLIEDNPGDALLVSEALREAGPGAFDLAHAARLDDALEHLSGGDFEAVLLDLNLPDSDGLATFHTLRKRWPTPAVIVLSGLDDSEVAVQAVREGAQDYLVKGHTPPELLSRAIRYAIARQRIPEALSRSRAE